jgi:hypothetical protein
LATHIYSDASHAGEFLRLNGIFLPVEVSAPSYARREGILSDAGVAIIDFGSSRTFVRQTQAIGLGLRQASFEDIITGSGETRVKSYIARLILPTLAWDVDPIEVAAIRTLRAVGTEPPEPILALIGRDMLLNCRFEWDGPKGKWSMHYP